MGRLDPHDVSRARGGGVNDLRFDEDIDPDRPPGCGWLTALLLGCCILGILLALVLRVGA